MLSDEGIVSEEVSVIKQARAVVMDKVLRVTLTLINALKQDGEGNFILKQINHGKVFLAHMRISEPMACIQGT